VKQNDDDRNRSKGYVVAAGCASLPVFYVLSIGPAVWLHERSSPAVQAILELIYAPLTWLYMHDTVGTWFLLAIDPWVEWWKS
jgi:arginine exporter protein ArgO